MSVSFDLDFKSIAKVFRILNEKSVFKDWDVNPTMTAWTRKTVTPRLEIVLVREFIFKFFRNIHNLLLQMQTFLVSSSLSPVHQSPVQLWSEAQLFEV